MSQMISSSKVGEQLLGVLSPQDPLSQSKQRTSSFSQAKSRRAAVLDSVSYAQLLSQGKMPALRSQDKSTGGAAPQACGNGRLCLGHLHPLDAAGRMVQSEPRHLEEHRAMIWSYRLDEDHKLGLVQRPARCLHALVVG